MQDTEERKSGIQAIARAGSVLRALESNPSGIGLADLAQQVDLPKSTVHRLVAALTTEGLAQTGSGGAITLGAGITRLAAARRDTLVQDLHPLLERLGANLEETVDLAILDGATARFVDQVPAPQRLRAVSAVGESFPLHCTANGKALLAALPPDEALGLIPAELPRFTETTIITRDLLLADLKKVQEQGVAYDREEYTEGICATGAAVIGPDGRAVAAISVPVPAVRFHANEGAYAAAILEKAREAAHLLASN